MDAKDGTSESSTLSSMFHASWVESSKNSEDILSSEEVAWIDSCLTTDSDILDSGWGALKDSLAEVITSQSQPLESAGHDIQMLHSTEEYGAERNNDGHRLFQLTEEVEEDDVAETYSPPHVDSDVVSLKNVFLPNHKEFAEEAPVPVDDDSKLLEVPEMEEESLSLSKEDIFKVWDLDIPDEEGEFEKQLNKALSSEVEDRDLLDKLVIGIADMSL